MGRPVAGLFYDAGKYNYWCSWANPFRIFDIVKPGPVRRLEKLPGGWGIMTDDVMAGIMAYFVLLLTYNFIL